MKSKEFEVARPHNSIASRSTPLFGQVVAVEFNGTSETPKAVQVKTRKQEAGHFMVVISEEKWRVTERRCPPNSMGERKGQI